MAKTGSTFLFLAKNNFDKSCFRYVPSPTVGLGLDVNYYKSRKINIYTGVNLQLKSYAARLYDFNVSNVEGFVSNRPTFASLEVPLVLNFEKKKNNKKENYIDYGCGVILSMNKAMLTTGKQHGPLFTIADESDTLNSEFSSLLDKSPYFSYDLYAGISYVKKVRQYKLFEWGLSFQYAMKKSANMNVNGYVSTTTERRDYSAIFNPKLSFIALHFTYYPQSLVIF